MSAWLLLIMFAASPILWVPVVQAVTTEIFGPFRLKRIDRLPDIILMIEPGTKKGVTFRGPES